MATYILTYPPYSSVSLPSGVLRSNTMVVVGLDCQHLMGGTIWILFGLCQRSDRLFAASEAEIARLARRSLLYKTSRRCSLSNSCQLLSRVCLFILVCPTLPAGLLGAVKARRKSSCLASVRETLLHPLQQSEMSRDTVPSIQAMLSENPDYALKCWRYAVFPISSCPSILARIWR